MLVALAEITTTPAGLLIIAAMAATIVLVWDWRVTLLCVFGVQLGLAANAVLEQGLPSHWALVESTVMGLACLILAMSANHVGGAPSQFQSGTWMLRLMTMALVVVAWQAMPFDMKLPEIETQVSQLYMWLGVCAIVTMSMSNSPFFIGAALLLWMMPVQAATSAILAIPSLTALLGMLELLVALACSYLILVELQPENAQSRILTDINFPTFQDKHERDRTRRPISMPHREIRSRTWPANNPDPQKGAELRTEEDSQPLSEHAAPTSEGIVAQPLRHIDP